MGGDLFGEMREMKKKKRMNGCCSCVALYVPLETYLDCVDAREMMTREQRRPMRGTRVDERGSLVGNES